MEQKQTLAQMVRAKYPGAYDDMDDAALDAQVRAKFPGVYDDIPSGDAKPYMGMGPDGQRRPMPTQGATDQPFNAPRIATDPRARAGEFVIGAAKSVPRAVLQLGQFVSEKTGFGDPAKFQSAREQLAPIGGEQQAGAIAGDIGMALAPAGAINRGAQSARGVVAGAKALANAPSWARTALGIGTAAGVEAAGAAATAVPLGADPKVAAVAGGAASGLSQAAMAAAPALGRRIESALMKAGKADVEDGFKVTNVFKHNLGGTLAQTYEKAQSKLKELGTQMQALLKSSNANVDLVDVLAKTERDLVANAPKTFGSNAKLKNALAEMIDEIDFVAGQAPNGVADLTSAQQIKQSVGEMGAWLHNPMGQNRDAASKATEVMANAYYRNLKDAIETASQRAPEIQKLNKEMSEIIPIVHAVVRRIPVAERQNVLKLGDQIGWGTGHIGLSIANRLLQSGRVANILAKTPESIRGASAIPALMPSHEVKK